MAAPPPAPRSPVLTDLPPGPARKGLAGDGLFRSPGTRVSSSGSKDDRLSSISPLNQHLGWFPTLKVAVSGRTQVPRGQSAPQPLSSQPRERRAPPRTQVLSRCLYFFSMELFQDLTAQIRFLDQSIKLCVGAVMNTEDMIGAVNETQDASFPGS